MKNSVSLAFITLFAATPATAASYLFRFDDGKTTFASGSLTTSDVLNTNKAYDLTAISGTIGNSAITGLLTSTLVAFYYENALRPQNADPLAGLGGLGLVAGGKNFNLFSGGGLYGTSAANPAGLYEPGAGIRAISVGTFRLTAVTVAGAVPEPATWAMMLIGFGGVGAAMRRRSKVRTRVSCAG